MNRRAPRIALRGRAAAAIAAGLGAGSCASPTAITVEVYTEVDCAEDAEVALTVSPDLVSLVERAPSSTSRGCAASGRVGDVVIAPADEIDQQVAFAIATRLEVAPLEDCLRSPIPADCILARRQIRFASGEDLRMRIDLRLSCQAIDCPPDQTCVKGACVPAALDPEDCVGGCDESVLGGGDGGAGGAGGGGPLGPCVPAGPVRLAGAESTLPRLTATADGFAATWISAEAGSTYTARMQRLDAEGALVVGDVPLLVPPVTQLANNLVGHDGQALGVIVNDPTARYLRVGLDGALLAGPSALTQIDTLNVHGMPWSGDRFGLTARDETTGELNFTTVTSDGTQGPVQLISSSGTWLTSAWDGARFGVSWRIFTDCSFMAFSPDGSVAVAPRSLSTSCYDTHVSPRPDGWNIAYETAGLARASYLRLDPGGDIVAGPSQVSPDDGQEYGAAQAKTLAGGATAVLFRRQGAALGELFVAWVDTAGAALVPPAPVSGAITDFYELSVLGDRLGVVWHGRADAADPAADGSYFSILCAPALP